MEELEELEESEELREDFVFLQRQYNAVVKQNRDLQRQIQEMQDEINKTRTENS